MFFLGKILKYKEVRIFVSDAKDLENFWPEWVVLESLLTS